MSLPPDNVRRFAIPWPNGDVLSLRGVAGATARVARFLHARGSELSTSSRSIQRWDGIAREAFVGRAATIERLTALMATNLEESSMSVGDLAGELEIAQERVRSAADEVDRRHAELERARAGAHEEAAQVTAISWAKAASNGDDHDEAYERAVRESQWAASVATRARDEYESTLSWARRLGQEEVERIAGFDETTARVLSRDALSLPGVLGDIAWLSVPGPEATWRQLILRDASSDARRLLELSRTDSLTRDDYELLRSLLEECALAASADRTYSLEMVGSLGVGGIDTVMQRLASISWAYGTGTIDIERRELHETLTVPFGAALGPGLTRDQITELAFPRYGLPMLLASGGLDTEQLAWAATLVLADWNGLRDHWGMEEWGRLMGPQFDWDSHYSDVAVAALVTEPAATVLALSTEVAGKTLSEELLTGHWDLRFGNLTVADVYSVAVTHLIGSGDAMGAGAIMERLLHEILPDGNDHGDVILIRLVAALTSLAYMPGLHDSARSVLPQRLDGGENGLVTSIRDGQIELSSKQLAELFGLIQSDQESRQTFLAGLASHRRAEIESWMGSGDDGWVADMGALDRHWTFGYEVANFESAQAAAAAIADRERVFDFVFGLLPAPGFGQGIAADVAGNLYGEIQGVFGDTIKQGFGSAPSGLDLAFDNQSFAQTTKEQGLLTVSQALLDADMIETPQAFTYAAYERVGGASIPLGVKFHSPETLQRLGLMDDFLAWFDDLGDAGLAASVTGDYLVGWDFVEELDT